MDAREEDVSDSEARGREKFAKERTDGEPEERRSRSRDRGGSPGDRDGRSPSRDDRMDRGQGARGDRDRERFHGRDRFRRRGDSFSERHDRGGGGRWNGRGRGRFPRDSRDRDFRRRGPDFRGPRDYPGSRFDDRRNDFHGGPDRGRGRDFKDSDRPEPTSHVRRMEPMETYKQFMMRQDDSNSPEVYQKRYEEYRKRYMQRLAEAFFADHKDEEWLRQRYSPLIHKEYQLDLAKRSAMQAKVMKEKILSGEFQPCLDDPETTKPLEGKPRESGKGSYALDDDTTLLYIKRVPCSCPEAPLRSAVGEGGPYRDLFLSDPAKKAHHDFERSGWIVYNTKEEAEEAMKAVNNQFIKDVPVPFRLQVYQHRYRAPILTPSFMSLPTRVQWDLEQATALAEALDVYRFTVEGLQLPDGEEEDICKTYGIRALLESAEVQERFPEEKDKLDIVITYLRLVHHFVYYHGTKCLDMGDLLHTQPALFKRRHFTQRDQEEDETRKKAVEGGEKVDRWPQWAVNLDDKIKAAMEQFSLEKRQRKDELDAKVVAEIEEKKQEAERRLYKLKIVPDDEAGPGDEKRRCAICSKLFKAASFVEKHIANKHNDVILQEHAKAAEMYMHDRYREDEQRPMPETQSNAGMPVIGFPHGNDMDRHAGPPPPGALLPLPGPPFGMPMPPPPMMAPPMLPPPPPPAAMGGGGFFGGRGRGRGRGRGGRGFFPRPPPENMPVDPRAGRVTSYVDVDNMQDKKVELDFSGISSLLPPKKKARVSQEEGGDGQEGPGPAEDAPAGGEES